MDINENIDIEENIHINEIENENCKRFSIK